MSELSECVRGICCYCTVLCPMYLVLVGTLPGLSSFLSPPARSPPSCLYSLWLLLHLVYLSLLPPPPPPILSFSPQLHRELHTGVLTNERLWAERLNPPPKSVPGGDVYGRVPPREPSTSITCPSCNRSVGAARYAPHLDKCALGSSRGRASRSARSSVSGVEWYATEGVKLGVSEC